MLPSNVASAVEMRWREKEEVAALVTDGKTERDVMREGECQVDWREREWEFRARIWREWEEEEEVAARMTRSKGEREGSQRTAEM